MSGFATSNEMRSRIPESSPTAVALGKLGGKEGGPARAEKLASTRGDYGARPGLLPS